MTQWPEPPSRHETNEAATGRSAASARYAKRRSAPTVLDGGSTRPCLLAEVQMPGSAAETKTVVVPTIVAGAFDTKALGLANRTIS